MAALRCEGSFFVLTWFVMGVAEDLAWLILLHRNVLHRSVMFVMNIEDENSFLFLKMLVTVNITVSPHSSDRNRQKENPRTVTIQGFSSGGA